VNLDVEYPLRFLKALSPSFKTHHFGEEKKYRDSTLLELLCRVG
jgi:hypothetical protein